MHSSFNYIFCIFIMDITSSNAWTIGPESECKSLFACEKNDTLSVPLFCAELIFIRDIRLFVCRLFFSTSPKLDGVRVTNTGTMLLCLKYIRWHEHRRILRILYSHSETERSKSRNYIDNWFFMYIERGKESEDRLGPVYRTGSKSESETSWNIVSFTNF